MSPLSSKGTDVCEHSLSHYGICTKANAVSITGKETASHKKEIQISYPPKKVKLTCWQIESFCTMVYY